MWSAMHLGDSLCEFLLKMTNMVKHLDGTGAGGEKVRWHSEFDDNYIYRTFCTSMKRNLNLEMVLN